MQSVTRSERTWMRKGFKTVMIDDNLAIAGELTWQEVIEPIEGFYEGQADVYPFLSEDRSLKTLCTTRTGASWLSTQRSGGFRPGDKWKVLERQSNGAFKLWREGQVKMFNPASKGKWNVYEASKMVVSVGDQVRITEGFKERGVAFKNNDIAKIAAIDADRITLDDGRTMRRDFLHLDQGVCITSYASECRTVRQMVAIAPLSAFAEMDAKTFYVLASRATHRAVFFTDCKEAFKEAVLRPGERQSVWDYEQGVVAKASPKEHEMGLGSKQVPGVDLEAGARKRGEPGGSHSGGM